MLCFHNLSNIQSRQSACNDRYCDVFSTSLRGSRWTPRVTFQPTIFTSKRQLVLCPCKVSQDEPQPGPVRAPEKSEEAWEYIDDRIRQQVYSEEWQDGLPLPFIAAVSSFGTALTGYLTWSKLTSQTVICPMSGCSSILDSPYSEIGGAPLSALGLLAYGSVTFLAFCSIVLKQQLSKEAYGPTPLFMKTQQGILYGSSILAGTSIALAVTLRAQFPDEFCLYCAASIAASLTLYGVSYAKLQDARKNLSFGSVIVTTLLITFIYATYPANVTARSEIPFVEPRVTMESPSGAYDLANDLKMRGAKMYGAFWCSHCFEQKQAFGKDAVSVLPYVECYPNGYTGPDSINRACTEADIRGFPTWVINGKKVEGDWPLPFLQSVLDGADPREEAKKY